MSLIQEDRDDSSSDDDNITKQALREATDTTFLKKSFFNHGKSSDDLKDDAGIRTNIEKFDEFGVSEGFKDFVAKKLTEFLDRNIMEAVTNEKVQHSSMNPKNEDGELNTGVRLLSNSERFLTILNVDSPSNTCVYKSKKRVAMKWNSDDHILRCRDVAVDAEWVLSKHNTKFWSERKKGIVFKYIKLADGTLIEE